MKVFQVIGRGFRGAGVGHAASDRFRRINAGLVAAGIVVVVIAPPGSSDDQERVGVGALQIVQTLAELGRLSARLGAPDCLLGSHAHGGTLALDAARMLHRPFVLDIAAPLLRPLADFASLRGATRVIAGSDAIAELAAHIRGPVGGITVVRDGVDVVVTAPFVRPGIDDGAVPEILVAGNANEGGGTDWLESLRAGIDASGCRANLRVIDDGQRTWALPPVAEGGGVVTSGRREPSGRIDAWIAQAAFVVAPQPRLSAFDHAPADILAAMAAGLAVVARAVPEFTELVGDAGLLSDPHDGAAFVRSVVRVLQHLELRQWMADASLERANSCLTWQVAVAKIRGILDDAMDVEISA